jgi:pyruvate/2-oxoglutarate dehydrogenase complex dihydrolipoamide acyltransferase (E2) component
MGGPTDEGPTAGGGRRAWLAVPDVGTRDPIVVSLWLVPEGSAVREGDRVVELVCGAATIDLEAPLDGRLTAQLVDEDETVFVGTPLATFEAAP